MLHQILAAAMVLSILCAPVFCSAVLAGEGAVPAPAFGPESPQTPPSLAKKSLPPRDGDKASDFTLKTLDGNPVQLSKQLANGPVVLVVLRGWPGYQCPICMRQVGDFLAQAKQFQALHARVIFVYPGPADRLEDHAREFWGDKILPEGLTFVIDPDYQFTLAYGLRWLAPRETAYPATFVID